MNDPFDAETMAGLRRCAKYIAMVVRNAMEDFHCRHLSDEQMAELNPIIRNAIYTALYAYHSEKDSKAADPFRQRAWKVPAPFRDRWAARRLDKGDVFYCNGSEPERCGPQFRVFDCYNKRPFSARRDIQSLV
jgi:hypothetical protein